MGLLRNIFLLSLSAAAAIDAAKILPVSAEADIIPDSYIIVMNDGISAEEFDAHKNWVADIYQQNGRIQHSGLERTFKVSGMQGYSGTFDSQTIDEISKRTSVCLPGFILIYIIHRYLYRLNTSNVTRWYLHVRWLCKKGRRGILHGYPTKTFHTPLNMCMTRQQGKML